MSDADTRERVLPPYSYRGRLLIFQVAAFEHVAAPSLQTLLGPQIQGLERMGAALAKTSATKIHAALAHCEKTGVDANAFLFCGGPGLWYSPLLALLARGTMASRAAVLSMLKKGPAAGAWRLEAQESIMVMGGSEGPLIARVPFHLSAVLLLALSVSNTVKNQPDQDQAATAAGQLDQLLKALEKWPPVDWQARAGGRDLLALLAEHASIPVVEGMWPALERLGVGRPGPCDTPWDPAGILEARLGKHAPVPRFQALLASWKALRMEHALPGASGGPRPGPRL